MAAGSTAPTGVKAQGGDFTRAGGKIPGHGGKAREGDLRDFYGRLISEQEKEAESVSPRFGHKRPQCGRFRAFFAASVSGF